MLFKGSATIADPKAEMTRRGARFNGTTGPDRTNYFATFSTDPGTPDWMVRDEIASRAASGFDAAEVASAKRAIVNSRATSLVQRATWPASWRTTCVTAAT